MKSPSRILIVDDEPHILRILSFKLRREGYITFEARSPDEAEEIVARHRVDLALLDVSLSSSTDGFELAAALRNNPATAGIVLVMLTARGRSVDILRGREVGADAYITKPFALSEVIDRLSTLLDSSGS